MTTRCLGGNFITAARTKNRSSLASTCRATSALGSSPSSASSSISHEKTKCFGSSGAFGDGNRSKSNDASKRQKHWDRAVAAVVATPKATLLALRPQPVPCRPMMRKRIPRPCPENARLIEQKLHVAGQGRHWLHGLQALELKRKTSRVLELKSH